MIRRITLLLLALVSVAGFAQKKKKGNTDVLFTIDGRTVNTDEFIYLYSKNNQSEGEKSSEEKVLEYLDLFINFKLKVEEARQRYNDTAASFLKEYNSYKQELRKPYLPEGQIIDSLVRQTYNRLKEEVRASHLLIRVDENAPPVDTLDAYNKIQSLKKRALDGEDFAALVDTYSEDPSARSNHGDLGYFTALQMVYPFENAAYRGKSGEVVGPIRTRFGYHLIRVADRKPARGEVEVAHIMLRTGAGNDDAKAKDLIFEIYDQLQGGVSWEDLCMKYSDDQSTRDNGGKLRPFGVGAMNSVPQFEQAAFSLSNPGAISDPFQTAYGWHIVKLIRKIPLPSFEELEPSLRQRVSRDERVQISKSAAASQLRRKLGFKENASVKEKMFMLADTMLTNAQWKPVLSKGFDKQVLFNTQARSVQVSEFVNYVKRNQRKVKVEPRQYIDQLYAAFVDDIINIEFDAVIAKENPSYGLLLNEYYEGILLFDIMEKEVWNKASNDSLGQAAYFNGHQEDFKAGERILGTIYFTTVKELIGTLKAGIEANDSTKLKEALKSPKLRYETGAFQRNDRPILAKIAWKPGLYEAENGGMYYLAHVEKMVPPGLLTFEEARPAVISDYQDYLEKVWLEQLKKKYPVKINDAGKKYVLEKLAQ